MFYFDNIKRFAIFFKKIKGVQSHLKFSDLSLLDENTTLEGPIPF